MTNIRKEIEASVEALVKDRKDAAAEYSKDVILADIGITSLDRVEIIMNLERDYAVLIPDDIYEGIKTPQDIINCLVKAVKIN